MHKLLFVIALFVSIVAAAQSKVMVSDNPQFNEIVKGFSGFPSSPTGKFLSAQIEKANAVNGVYRNVVRLWYGKGNSDYINLVYSTFPTEGEAKDALKEEIRKGNSRIYLDWDAMEGSSKIIDLSKTTFSEGSGNQFVKSRGVRRTVSTMRKVKEEKSFELSFDGLELEQQRNPAGPLAIALGRTDLSFFIYNI